jgi:hypothetical protein
MSEWRPIERVLPSWADEEEPHPWERRERVIVHPRTALRHRRHEEVAERRDQEQRDRMFLEHRTGPAERIPDGGG